ncbi:hypothetical protein D3C81_1773010 [compost metagenome]
MITDPQCHRVVNTSDPLGQHALMRHQPGIGTRPGAGHAGHPDIRKVFEEKIELADVVCDQNQALVHRAVLDGQQAVHRLFVPGIATQTPDGFGWIGNDRTCSNFTRGLLHTPTAHHALSLLRKYLAVYLANSRKPTPCLIDDGAFKFQFGQGS